MYTELATINILLHLLYCTFTHFPSPPSISPSIHRPNAFQSKSQISVTSLSASTSLTRIQYLFTVVSFHVKCINNEEIPKAEVYIPPVLTRLYVCCFVKGRFMQKDFQSPKDLYDQRKRLTNSLRQEMIYLGYLGKTRVSCECKTSRFQQPHLPENLLFTALRSWESFPGDHSKRGCLGKGVCHREDQGYYALRVCFRVWLNKKKTWGEGKGELKVSRSRRWPTGPRWHRSCSHTCVNQTPLKM